MDIFGVEHLMCRQDLFLRFNHALIVALIGAEIEVGRWELCCILCVVSGIGFVWGLGTVLIVPRGHLP